VSIDSVVRHGPAERAGLKSGDRIVAVNGVGENNPQETAKTFRLSPIGSVLTIDLLRGGERKRIAVTTVAFDKVNSKEVLLPLAQQGDASAQFDLALFYSSGEGNCHNPARAAFWFRKAADGGHRGAEYNLGWIYQSGRDLPQDFAQAASWYRKAAEQGYSRAEFSLAGLYEDGMGVPQDGSQAVFWYRKAAEQGHPEAEFKLGWLCENNLRGAPSDHAQAAVWYRKAAERGHVEAAFKLAEMCESSVGVSQDYVQAALWYRKAADQGNADAAFRLARLYLTGTGVPKDDAQAASWFRKAADHGNIDAQRQLASLNKDGWSASRDSNHAVSQPEKSQAQTEALPFEKFRQQAAAWRALAVKPELPGDCRKQGVMAESYLPAKEYKGAIRQYELGVEACPTWPEAWFNLAALYAETGEFAHAADQMKHYLELMPDAPDASAARDQIILWESKASQARTQP
jgi:TPR repeat protein